MPDPLPPRPVGQSAVRDQTAVVFPNDLNPLGTLFGGRVLEQADRVAAVVARRHAGRVCVTLGVDAVRFLAPARHGDLLVFQAAVNRAWRTSLEVGVKVWAEDFRNADPPPVPADPASPGTAAEPAPPPPRRHIFSAYFTFVAVDDGLRPVAVAPALPETPDEHRRHAAADRRRRARLARLAAPPGGA